MRVVRVAYSVESTEHATRNAWRMTYDWNRTHL
jgi:hypothetical protein